MDEYYSISAQKVISTNFTEFYYHNHDAIKRGTEESLAKTVIIVKITLANISAPMLESPSVFSDYNSIKVAKILAKVDFHIFITDPANYSSSTSFYYATLSLHRYILLIKCYEN